MSRERWMVVGKGRAPVVVGMFSREAAEDEAAMLNREGLEEFRPYRVVRDEVAMSLEEGYDPSED
jgi:hypothetical protein